MWNCIELPLKRLAMRRALRSVRRAKHASWLLREILRNRLQSGLASPDEVLAAIRSSEKNADRIADLHPEGWEHHGYPVGF